MKRTPLIILVLISGCSATLAHGDEKSILTVNRGDMTYWTRTKAQIPIYPYKALRDRVDGCVNVSYIVSTSGKVKSLKVIGSYPESVFVKSAKKAVKQYRYQATEQNVEKLPVRTNEIVTFLLAYPDYSSPSKEEIEAKCEVVNKN